MYIYKNAELSCTIFHFFAVSVLFYSGEDNHNEVIWVCAACVSLKSKTLNYSLNHLVLDKPIPRHYIFISLLICDI